jgi:hypothetical protein
VATVLYVRARLRYGDACPMELKEKIVRTSLSCRTTDRYSSLGSFSS